MSPIFLSLFWFIVLAIALTVLLKSAAYFVSMAELFGKKFKIPPFIIGATVVAFGTSLPELAVGVISVLQDKSDIVTGTVFGSNISNILFILGTGIALSTGFIMKFSKLKVELLIMMVATILASYFLYDKVFSLTEAFIFIALLIVYLVYVIKFSKNDEEEAEDTAAVDIKVQQYILFGLSVFGVWVGAKFTTDAITVISQNLNLGNDIISQTVVALGTSLPELAVTIAAVRSKQFGIILGNVIGSNIFNLLAVIAIPAIVGFATKHPYLVQDDTFNQFSIPIMILASLLLIIASMFKSTPKIVGVLFLVLYIFFMVGSFMKINLLHLI